MLQLLLKTMSFYLNYMLFFSIKNIGVQVTKDTKIDVS